VGGNNNNFLSRTPRLVGSEGEGVIALAHSRLVVWCAAAAGVFGALGWCSVSLCVFRILAQSSHSRSHRCSTPQADQSDGGAQREGGSEPGGHRERYCIQAIYAGSSNGGATRDTRLSVQVTSNKLLRSGSTSRPALHFSGFSGAAVVDNQLLGIKDGRNTTACAPPSLTMGFAASMSTTRFECDTPQRAPRTTRSSSPTTTYARWTAILPPNWRSSPPPPPSTLTFYTHLLHLL
jgi:hypothetical protein